MTNKISITDNLITLTKDDGSTYTFVTTNIDNNDWRLSFTIKLVKFENPDGIGNSNILHGDLLEVYEFYKKKIKSENEKYFEFIKLNRETVIDYLNLQRLGIVNYQKTIGKMLNAKPLTIRDRIAYARRKGWITKSTKGTRWKKVGK